MRGNLGGGRPTWTLDEQMKEGTSMTTNADDSNHQIAKTGRSLVVRKAAARAAITASKKTGRPVDERVRKLADSR